MSDKPQILTQIYDFLLYLIQQISKFPKNQRYNLGERIENIALDVFESIVEALYSKDKILVLRRANLALEKIRILIRLAKDLQLINLHRYEVMTKMLHELGADLGGWIKQQKSK